MTDKYYFPDPDNFDFNKESKSKHLNVDSGDIVETWVHFKSDWITDPCGWWDSWFIVECECLWSEESLIGLLVLEDIFIEGWCKHNNVFCITRKRSEVVLKQKYLDVDNIVSIFEAGKFKI